LLHRQWYFLCRFANDLDVADHRIHYHLGDTNAQNLARAVARYTFHSFCMSSGIASESGHGH
jgi:hypothetical protein